MTSRCYYEVLAVEQDASVGEIKKSYHAQALKYHPDKNAGDEQATEMFRQARRPSLARDPQALERVQLDRRRCKRPTRCCPTCRSERTTTTTESRC